MFSQRLRGYPILYFIIVTRGQAPENCFVPLNSDYYDLLDRYEIKWAFLKNFHSDCKTLLLVRDVAQFIETIAKDTSFHAVML